MILRRDYEYITSFVGSAANPLSEGGRWRNGLATALNWSNVQTTNGRAFGTQSGIIGPPYNDSVAVLDPLPGQVWSSDQQVIGRVFITDQTGWASFKEVECLLRATMAAGSLKLYEVLFSVIGGTTYIQIVRWNGLINEFEEIAIKSDWTGLTNGTYVRGLISGNTIEAATSPNGSTWTTLLTGNIVTGAADGISYPYGSPGIGFWNREPTNGANNTFGFDYVAARNL